MNSAGRRSGSEMHYVGGFIFVVVVLALMFRLSLAVAVVATIVIVVVILLAAVIWAILDAPDPNERIAGGDATMAFRYPPVPPAAPTAATRAIEPSAEEPPSGLSNVMVKGLNRAISFSYRDRYGRITSREANVHAIHGDTDWVPIALTARCHLRRAERTFLLDRMSDLVDLSTGEVIESPLEWALDVYMEASS